MALRRSRIRGARSLRVLSANFHRTRERATGGRRERSNVAEGEFKSLANVVAGRLDETSADLARYDVPLEILQAIRNDAGRAQVAVQHLEETLEPIHAADAPFGD